MGGVSGFFPLPELAFYALKEIVIRLALKTVNKNGQISPTWLFIVEKVEIRFIFKIKKWFQKSINCQIEPVLPLWWIQCGIFSIKLQFYQGPFLVFLHHIIFTRWAFMFRNLTWCKCRSFKWGETISTLCRADFAFREYLPPAFKSQVL